MKTPLFTAGLHKPGVLVPLLGLILTIILPSIGRSNPWDDVSSGLFNEAHAAFKTEAAKPGAPDPRSARYGEAIALLNLQPRTQTNIDAAYKILDEIHAAKPDDDLGLNARYLQGRVEQVQRSTPDLAKADAIFSELVNNHLPHPVAQRAMVKLAIIRLYADVDAAERRRRYDAFTTDAGRLTDHGAKVQLHLLLAEYARRLDFGNQAELNHTLAAYEAGVTKRRLLVEVLVRIADLARLTGDKTLARQFYTRFLEQFPRTDRRSTVEGYLAALGPAQK